VDRVKAGAASNAAPTGDERVHTVQVGDTLEKISRQYYGVPERWRSIYDANRALLGNGQPLRAGMELKLP
jgi:nucleoid-associated protein YgaU